MDLLNGNSYMSLLAVNIAEFVDQHEMCEKLILVGLRKKVLMKHFTIFCEGVVLFVFESYGRWP